MSRLDLAGLARFKDNLLALVGRANGIAGLDANGRVPSSQLPSYVDDVVEYERLSDFPAAGESGKIYIATGTNKSYRWSGSQYTEISSSLALGTTSETAFPGDQGAMAYSHAVTNKGAAYSNGLYKITTNSEGHVTGATAVTKGDITGLGIPAQDTTYPEATTTNPGLMSSSDKTKLNGIATGAEVNVQADWTNVDASSDAYIANKPTIGNSPVWYGTCATAAATAAKVVVCEDFNSEHLVTGATIRVKFTYANTVANPTLNVNGTGAIAIKRYGTTAPSTSAASSWNAGAVVSLTYDGTYWMLDDWLNNNDNTVPQAHCTTAAATAAKGATCTYYTATAKSYLMVTIRYANTVASALTLNVNSQGAKPIYINGTASSASNYTLPAGSYLTYYDGTNYYFRTDGKITGDITGNASTVNGLSVETAVPASAVFTDTHRPIQVNGTQILASNTTA